MLHNPDDMSALGKFVSTDYRYAALKVASRGHKRILLRKTNTREVREFTGDVVDLATPKEIHRGDRVITYSKRPVVRFVRKFTFDFAGEEAAPAAEATAAEATAAEAPAAAPATA